MSLTNTIGMVPRDPTGYHVQGDLWSVGAYAELLIGGGTAFTSSANPSAVDVKGTGVSSGRLYRMSLDATAGTITATDAGDYEVGFALDDHSEQTASGNVQYTLVYAPDGVTFAAFSATETAGGGGRMQAIALALTTKERLHCTRIQRLNSGSKIKLQVTSAAGDVCTITEGRIFARKVADVDPPANP